jgi:hypothetical protein
MTPLICYNGAALRFQRDLFAIDTPDVSLHAPADVTDVTDVRSYE